MRTIWTYQRDKKNKKNKITLTKVYAYKPYCLEGTGIVEVA